MKWRIQLVGLIYFLILSNQAYSQDIYKNEQQRQAAFRLILSDELIEIYDLILTSAGKEKWERKYWKVFDPTPADEKNEIYEEFIARFLFAQRYYSNIISPLFLDDRGKYYLKYGEPDDKSISVGVGKPYRDNETWVYYDYNLFIDFVDQTGFGYREVNSLMEAVSSGPANIKTQIAADLYTERVSLHQKYTSFRDIVDGSAGMTAEALFYQLIRDLDSEKKLILGSSPLSQFDYSHNKERLDAHFSSAVFRGSNNLSRVEFYYSFPLSQLSFRSGTQARYESVVEKQLAVFNENFDKILQTSETLKLAAGNEQDIEKRIYINQHIEELPPRLYNLALQLDSPESNRLAILRAQLNVKDYSGDSLMISDIQLSPQVREGVYGSRNVKPNGILVVPYIGHVIRKANPIYVYFEIYNLSLNEDHKTRFKVSYEVRSITGAPSSAFASMIQFFSHLVGKSSQQQIGSSFETEGSNEFQQIYLKIDFSKFPAGSCSLSIWIEDLEIGAKTIGRRTLVLK